jgi:hypothetical protein
MDQHTFKNWLILLNPIKSRIAFSDGYRRFQWSGFLDRIDRNQAGFWRIVLVGFSDSVLILRGCCCEIAPCVSWLPLPE